MMEIELSNTIKLVFTELDRGWGDECYDSLAFVFGKDKAHEMLRELIIIEAYNHLQEIVQKERIGEL